MYAQLILELLIIIFIDILINLDILVVKKMWLLNNNVVLVVNSDKILIKKRFTREVFFLVYGRKNSNRITRRAYEL